MSGGAWDLAWALAAWLAAAAILGARLLRRRRRPAVGCGTCPARGPAQRGAARAPRPL